MSPYGMFAEMQYSDSVGEIKEWIPPIMEGRNRNKLIADVRMSIGTDVNFGAITRSMVKYLNPCEGIDFYLCNQVEDIK
jgi:malate dehydrogenase (quinone)